MVGLRYCTYIQITAQQNVNSTEHLSSNRRRAWSQITQVPLLSDDPYSHPYTDFLAMLKPLVVASTPAHNGRVIQVSTERLRYSNGREYDIDYVQIGRAHV